MLLCYNVRRNGLHLSKGSLAEVLSTASQPPLSHCPRWLDAVALNQQLSQASGSLLFADPAQLLDTSTENNLRNADGFKRAGAETGQAAAELPEFAHINNKEALGSTQPLARP